METEWDRQKERGNKHSYLGLWKELLMRERERENSLKQTPSPPSWGGEKVGWDDPAKSSAPSKWKTKAHGESKIQTTQRTNAISFAVNTQNWKRMLHWCFHVLCSFIGSKQQWKCQKNISKCVARQHCMASMTGHASFELFIFKGGRF